MKKTKIIAAALCALFMVSNVVAQELPKPSPAAKVEQRIGLTDITVAYSRPRVKDRIIWGEIVPFDKIWRTGANFNTLITFSDDVKVDGQALKAGTYSFFTIPSQGEWKVMFNSVIDGWGDGKYAEANNVLTLSTPPVKGLYQESMRFTFEKLTKTTGNLVLAWDVVGIDLLIEVDVEKKAWSNIDQAIAEIKDDNKAEVYRNAAKYTASTKKRLEEGLKWIEASIAAKTSWYSYWVKADVQHAAGDNAGAIASAKKAIELGEARAKETGKPFNYKTRLEAAIADFQ